MCGCRENDLGKLIIFFFIELAPKAPVVRESLNLQLVPFVQETPHTNNRKKDHYFSAI